MTAVPIKFNDRVLILGPTGCGKSELLNMLFSRLAGGPQLVLVDTKHEFAVKDIGPTTQGVDSIVWTAPVVHYQDQGRGTKEMQQLFKACHARRRIVVAVEELSDVCNFNAGSTPPAFDAYVSKGRALGQGLLAASQRPCEIPSRARSEAQHVFLFAEGFTLPQDTQAAAHAMAMDHRHLADKVLPEVLAQFGKHAFLHFTRETRVTEVCPPLTEAERSGMIITRPTLY